MKTESEQNAKSADRNEHDEEMLGQHDKSDMTAGDREQMLQEEHRKMLWTHLVNVALGVWLITSPVTFGYQKTGMIWSDATSGALLVIFGLLALDARRLWAP